MDSTINGLELKKTYEDMEIKLGDKFMLHTVTDQQVIDDIEIDTLTKARDNHTMKERNTKIRDRKAENKRVQCVIINYRPLTILARKLNQ